MSSRGRVATLFAATCGGWGLFLAWHHPVAPALALVLFCAVALAAARWPRLWLFLVPACLPWLNFSPWTGWLMVEEFDLLVLAVLVGGYGRPAFQPALPSAGAGAGSDRVVVGLVALLLLSGAVGLVRGLTGHDGVALDWYQGYDEPLNSLRASKSLVWGVCLLPLVRQALQHDSARACNKLLLGMGAGLLCVATAALWERMAYPGLTDFSTVYRVTALFWEMHVGGGAIDAYLAMASPFAVMLLLRSRGLVMRLLAVVLLAGVAYACLTTYSRGVYVAVTVPLLLVALWDLSARVMRRLWPASVAGAAPADRAIPRVYWALLLVPALVVWFATGPTSFLSNRLTSTEHVWAQRLQHWQNSLNLLESPGDWWFGIGSGRYPALYSRQVPGGSFAGAATAVVEDGNSSLRLFGPVAGEKKGGLIALTQRIAIVPGASYRIHLDARPMGPAVLVMQVCERHLLYDWACQGAALRVAPLQAVGFPEHQPDS